MVKKLNLKLSFEAQSYKWTVFSFFCFVLFYIRVMSLPFLANSRWNDIWHWYTYWFITICSYNLSFIFFYLIIINVLFLSHFRIFYCRFHVVECSVINCTNPSETRKLFSRIVYIVVRLKKFKVKWNFEFCWSIELCSQWNTEEKLLWKLWNVGKSSCRINLLCDMSHNPSTLDPIQFGFNGSSDTISRSAYAQL